MHGGKLYVFSVFGQQAKALKALVNAKKKGITALEVAGWAYRLASYCHILRSTHGLNIRTDKEKHESGWHARYVLQTDVTIANTEHEKKAA